MEPLATGHITTALGRRFSAGMRAAFGFALDTALPPLCPACRDPVAVRYDAIARTRVHAFKYGDRIDLAPAMGRWMAQAGAEMLDGAHALVPVPLHWRRQWARRFNQSAALAKVMPPTAGFRSPTMSLSVCARLASRSGSIRPSGTPPRARRRHA